MVLKNLVLYPGDTLKRGDSGGWFYVTYPGGDSSDDSPYGWTPCSDDLGHADGSGGHAAAVFHGFDAADSSAGHWRRGSGTAAENRGNPEGRNGRCKEILKRKKEQ